MTGRRAPRPDPLAQFFTPDPMDAVVFRDTLGLAGDLETVLSALAPYDQSTIKGIIHRKPPGGLGKFEWVEAVAPPIDMAEIAGSLKARFGGGDYRLTLFAEGKTRKVIEFPIMADPSAALRPAIPANDQAAGGDRMMMMMMQMQDQARREQADRDEVHRREAREAQERAETRQAARDANLLGIAGIALPLLVPLFAGNKDKVQDQIALFTALKGDGNNLKDTAEMMLTFKKLFGDDKAPGFDPENIVASLGGMAGPMIAAAGRAFGAGRGGAAGQGEEAPSQLYLPEPDAPPALVLAAPPAAAPAPPGAPAHPLLALIGPHVLYFMNAGHDPALAAEAIADIMDRKGISDGDLIGLAALLKESADWKADLAAFGLDLTGHPEWADLFIGELLAAFDLDGDGDSGTGGNGGEANAAPDAGAGARRVGDDANPGKGAGADKPRVRRPKGPPAEG